jgi:hypothetical protein
MRRSEFVYRRDVDLVTVVRVWRGERLMDPELAANVQSHSVRPSISRYWKAGISYSANERL